MSKAKKIISLDHKNNRVNVDAFELDNPIVFEFFVHNVTADQYDDTLLRAIYIGVLA